MHLSVQVSKTLGRSIVPWTVIIEFYKEGLSFGDLLSSINKGQFFSVIEVSDINE